MGLIHWLARRANANRNAQLPFDVIVTAAKRCQVPRTRLSILITAKKSVKFSVGIRTNPGDLKFFILSNPNLLSTMPRVDFVRKSEGY